MYHQNGKIKTKQMLLILILPAVAVGLFISYYLLRFYWIHTVGMTAHTSTLTRRLISRYIQENNGNFPTSEDDLINKKYIKKLKTHTGYEYYLNLGPPEFGEDVAYHKNAFFESLKIAYGTKLEDIELIDGKLYEKFTDKQILLIDGPYRKILKRKCYEPISVKLYEQMLKKKSE